jgi:GNAT superfamily N-acetyltransferase
VGCAASAIRPVVELLLTVVRHIAMAGVRVEVTEDSPPDWVAYGSVPIRFTTRTTVGARPLAAGGFELVEHALHAPLVKDYDSLHAEGPSRWATRFDVSNWGVLVARADGERVGGVVLVADTAGVDLLEGRSDLAVCWDLRVRPEWRGRGVGTALFQAAEDWARRRGKAELKVETQNINPAACRFYARRGCELRSVDEHAYPTLPGEVQFLWYKRLREDVGSRQAASPGA